MEGIVLAVIFYVLGLVFDKGKNKNKESFNQTGKNIKDRINKLKTVVNKEKTKEEEINVHSIVEETDKKYEPIQEKKPIEKNVEKKIKQKREEREDGFPLFQDSNDLVRGVILSEILSKPKSLK